MLASKDWLNTELEGMLAKLPVPFSPDKYPLYPDIPYSSVSF
jgi:hypothetical protein